MTLKNAYDYSLNCLNKNNIDEAEFKALCIVCSLSGIKNSEYQFHIEDEVDEMLLSEALLKLISGEPLQYVLGKWDFFESEFYVGKGVLIPRPETEELVERAIKECKKYENPVVYDLCSGSGCIGISIAKKLPESTVYCIEISDDALYYLRKNAKGVPNVKVIKGDITKPFNLPKADIIVSNPPYIPTGEISNLQKEVQKEPVSALDGGDDGLKFYRAINDIWHKKLKQNGSLLLEIGNNQGESVPEVLNSFSEIEVIKDIYKNDRIVIAKP